MFIHRPSFTRHRLALTRAKRFLPHRRTASKALRSLGSQGTPGIPASLAVLGRRLKAATSPKLPSSLP